MTLEDQDSSVRPSGGRNALTPLDTASNPVRDEPPLANARPSMKNWRRSAGCWCSAERHRGAAQAGLGAPREKLPDQADDDHQTDDQENR